jgi:hypothetical protein
VTVMGEGGVGVALLDLPARQAIKQFVVVGVVGLMVLSRRGAWYA